MAEGYVYSECKKLVKEALSKGLSVFLWGHPGTGKSTMAQELAEEMALPLIDIRLAQQDPTEVGGILYPDRERGESVWMRPSWVPLEKPAFIFLDEMNAAVTRLHQSVAYQIVLEKRIRDWYFADGTMVLAAGNLEEDMSIVQPLSQALANRFVHFKLKVDVDEWLLWAKKAGISDKIRAYISFRREKSLYNNTNDVSFPSPRSWEFASKLIKDIVGQKRYNKTLVEKLVASAVGHGEAKEFMAFLQTYKKVDIDALVKKGKVPNLNEEDPSFLHALVFSLASYYNAHYKSLKKEHYKNIISLFEQNAMTNEYLVLFLYQLELDALVKFSQRKDTAKILRPVAKIIEEIVSKKYE